MSNPIKVILQIPCYNEENSLPITLEALKVLKLHPIIGGKTINYELLIIDDGSHDNTIKVAQELGVHHIVKLPSHKGLATGWKEGITAALFLNADVIVNLDADNQYGAECIPALIEPILNGTADMVIGARNFDKIDYFSPTKRLLQRVGSWFVSTVAGLKITDATSGFRAYNIRAAALLNVFSKYTYTLETILHAGACGLTVKCVPVTTNDKLRESRLLKSNWSYIKKSLLTLSRVFLHYNPLLCFSLVASVFLLPSVGLIVRFLLHYFSGGTGLVQSLIIGSMLFCAALLSFAVGIVAHLVALNRRLLEKQLMFSRAPKEKLTYLVPSKQLPPNL
jgi:glycosyltransferase involved in cell wall biosynthesis